MRYFGGKFRIHKMVSEILNDLIENENQTFLSPFVGGAWVEHLINSKYKICADSHKYLIDMYNALQNGWILPNSISEEEYKYIKDNLDEKSYLSGFVGFACSFAGKWFGGYVRDRRNYSNYCLSGKNSLLKQMRNLQRDNTIFLNCDYTIFSPNNMIIYCDPPYRNTTKYSKITGKFDHNEFWDTMRLWSKNNIVIISEYNAPEDFECIWEYNTKTDIRNKNGIGEIRIEKLFRFKF